VELNTYGTKYRPVPGSFEDGYEIYDPKKGQKCDQLGINLVSS